MAKILYHDLGQHKDCKGGEKTNFFYMELPTSEEGSNVALVQAFFPELYISNSSAEHVLKVEMEATKPGGKDIVTSAEITMKGNEVIAPPLSLLAKVDLLKKTRTVTLTFLLKAPATVTLQIGRGVYPAPWTCGALTAQLLDA